MFKAIQAARVYSAKICRMASSFDIPASILFTNSFDHSGLVWLIVAYLLINLLSFAPPRGS